jgi:hypothetical protein
MVNTKLDIHICGPTSVFHFDPHPYDIPSIFPGFSHGNPHDLPIAALVLFTTRFSPPVARLQEAPPCLTHDLLQ